MTACLSSFAMDDRALHGPIDAAVDRHLGECRRCRTRFEERARVVAAFETDGSAATSWARIAAGGHASAERARPRHRVRARWWWLGLSGVLASAGAAAALLVTAGSGGLSRAPAPYLAPKGGALPTALPTALPVALPVEVLCRRGDRTFVLAPDESVAPGDRLRFRPLPARTDVAFIQIGSVDGRGVYSPFYPAADRDESVPLPPAGQALDGAIALDAAPGPERVFVVLSARPLRVSDVRRAALEGAARLANPDQIGGVSVWSGWVALRKEVTATPTEPSPARPSSR